MMKIVKQQMCIELAIRKCRNVSKVHDKFSLYFPKTTRQFPKNVI